MKLKGARILIECLLEQGVDCVFGYPGGQVIDIFDELYKEDKIKQVLTAHEQGAAHAADGYARASGKTGVVIATSGPGATNLVTGIATAYLDSVPLVAITGNVPSHQLGRDSFQEVDIAGITMPITKHNYIVKDINQLADVLREAFLIAKSNRPGPVLVDIPKDVQQALADYEYKEPEKRVTPQIQADITKAVQIIKDSKKPIIYAGGGCMSGAEALLKFAQKIDAPVALSVMGLGALPARSPYHAGLIGMHGHASVAKELQECDTLIAIGARFSDRVAANRTEFCRNAKIVHIDIDNAEIDKNVLCDAYITGDVSEVLTLLCAILPQKDNGDWVAHARALKKQNPLAKSSGKLCPRKILRTLNRMTADSQIITTDVGQHQMWTAQTYDFENPRTFLTSGGLGTMGFGLGAAIGAAKACNDRVCLITGDGSFCMNFNEITTAVRQNLNIKIFIFNNGALGMVRQWQTLFYGKRYSSTDLTDLKTDYVLLAKALGASGMVLDADKDIETVLTAALNTKGTVVVDCRIYNNEFVLPMIPPGKGVENLITELKDE